MLTKKDFKMFAEILATTNPDKFLSDTETKLEHDARKRMWIEILHEAAGVFSDENPRFDFEKFCKACGL